MDEDQGAAPDAAREFARLRDVPWHDRTYNVEIEMGLPLDQPRVAVVNGTWEGRQGVEGESYDSAGGVPFRVTIYEVKYGDITGDGVEEAAVSWNYYTGGGKSHSGWTVYRLANGQPVPIHIDEVDYAIQQVSSLAFSHDGVVITRPHLGDDDANCCPSFEEIERFAWNGERLESQGVIVRPNPESGNPAMNDSELAPRPE